MSDAYQYLLSHIIRLPTPNLIDHAKANFALFSPLQRHVAATLLAVLCIHWLLQSFKRLVYRTASTRLTGIQRRRTAPPNYDISKHEGPVNAFARSVSSSAAVKNVRSFATLRNGHNIFVQTWEPESVTPTAAVIIVHGLGDHSDFLVAESAKALL